MEAIERPTPSSFGTEGMKRLKVCPRCASFVSAKLRICSQCGERLPQNSLFQIYQKSHRLCPVCDTVLSNSMKFCPHCGMKIAIQKYSGGREGK